MSPPPPPVVICVAPNGARRGKQDHAALPLTPQELAAEARACQLAGATAIHVHIRDTAGKHSLDASTYRHAVELIREATEGGMVIQITTEAVGIFSPDDQIACIEAVLPECASIALKELVPDQTLEHKAARFFDWALNRGIGIQYVLYDAMDVQRAVELAARGVIPHQRPHCLLVLGRYSATQTSEPNDLPVLLRHLPGGWPFTVCAFGATENACMQAAVEAGGNCRVGFENNFSLPDGRRAEGNADLVSALSSRLAGSSRALGTVEDARALYLSP